MRHPVIRTRASAALAALALATSTLAGCDRLKPFGESDTMSLLKEGSQQVCVATDVQAAIRKVLLPDVSHSTDTTTLEQRQKALAAISLSYELTTMQAFDKVVTKATCSTTVHLSGLNNQANTFKLAFDITPSADRPGTFVVGLDSPDARAYAQNLFADAVDDAVAKRYVQQQAEDDAKSKAQVLAMITDKWLIGTWIGAGQPSSRCASNAAVTFERGHILEGAFGVGRWSLSADRLHIISDPAGGHLDRTSTITGVDAVSFTLDPENGPLALRRCTSQEVEAAQGDVLDENSDMAEVSDA